MNDLGDLFGLLVLLVSVIVATSIVGTAIALILMVIFGWI